MTYDEFDTEGLRPEWVSNARDAADYRRKYDRENPRYVSPEVEAAAAAAVPAVVEDGALLPHPETGELLPATVSNALQIRLDADRIIDACKRVKDAANDVLLAEAERIGAKTLHLDGRTVTVTGDKETVWDVQALVDGLLDAGLPPERVGDLVRTTVTEEVRATVARQLAAANDEYAKVIDRCKTVVQKRGYVSVK